MKKTNKIFSVLLAVVFMLTFLFSAMPSAVYADEGGDEGEILYKVTFESNGGSEVEDEYVVPGDFIPEPEDPVRDGFSFAGWMKNEKLTKPWDFEEDVMPGKDITLYADWIEDEQFYQIMFEENGAESGSVPDTLVVTYGDSVILPGNVGNLEKSGYSFDGWNTAPDGTGIWLNGGDSAELSAYAENDVVRLYAEWASNEILCNVTLDSMGGTGGTELVTAAYGADMPAAGMPQRSGYTFGGYFDQQNGAGTQYYAENGSSARAWDKTEDSTLYAFWRNQIYAVTLYPNGGTINSGNISGYTAGQGVILPTDVTRSGYIFKGWYADNGFNGQPVIQIGTDETGDKQFWACWELGGSAQDCINKIDAIGPVGFSNDCKLKIDAARKAYDALSADDKKLVTNYNKLTDAEAQYASLVRINDCISKINAIGTVAYTDACKTLIDAARNAYDALTSDEKQLVTTYSVLVEAEEAYAALAGGGSYKITKGMNSIWTKGSGQDLVITGDGDFNLFSDVKLDGVVLDAAAYEAAPGSTVITLKSAFLETVSVGAHSFEIVWDNGSAATSITVTDITPTPTSAPSGGNTGIWIALIILIVVFVIILIVMIRLKKSRKEEEEHEREEDDSFRNR
ncbi:MAG: InlB B-repeat-containing protein [Eubacterium sp.]|nr:InlB B-repeat-containing protein [Eubacterium sp.]